MFTPPRSAHSSPALPKVDEHDLEQGVVAASSTESAHSTAVEAVPSSIRDYVTLATHALGSYVEGRVYHNSMKPHYELPQEYTEKLAELGSCAPEQKQKLAALMFVLVMLLKSPKNRRSIIDGYMCQDMKTFDRLTRYGALLHIYDKGWNTFFNNLTFAVCEDLAAAFYDGNSEEVASALAQKLELSTPAARAGTSSPQDDIQVEEKLTTLLKNVQENLNKTCCYSVLDLGKGSQDDLLALLDCVELNKLDGGSGEVFKALMWSICRDLCQIGSQGAFIVDVFLQEMTLKKQILFAGYEVNIFNIPPPKKFMKETLDMLIRWKDLNSPYYNAPAVWSVSGQEASASSDAEDFREDLAGRMIAAKQDLADLDRSLRTAKDVLMAFLSGERREVKRTSPKQEEEGSYHDQPNGSSSAAAGSRLTAETLAAWDRGSNSRRATISESGGSEVSHRACSDEPLHRAARSALPKRAASATAADSKRPSRSWFDTACAEFGKEGISIAGRVARVAFMTGNRHEHVRHKWHEDHQRRVFNAEGFKTVEDTYNQYYPLRSPYVGVEDRIYRPYEYRYTVLPEEWDTATQYVMAAHFIQRCYLRWRVRQLCAKRVSLKQEIESMEAAHLRLMHLEESAAQSSAGGADRDNARPQKQRFGIIQVMRGIGFGLLCAWAIASVVLIIIYPRVTLSVLDPRLNSPQLTAGIGVVLVGAVLLLELCSMMRRRGDALDGQGPSIISPPLSSVEVGKPSPQESAAHKQPLSPSSSLEKVGDIPIKVLR